MAYRQNEHGHYVSCDYCGAETKPLRGVPFVSVSLASEAGWDWGTGHEPETFHICRECRSDDEKAALFNERKRKAHITQSQGSLDWQLRKLIPLANKAGLYDAAEYLKTVVTEQASS